MFLRSYTRALKNYDRDLFADRNRDGVACVFRKVKRWVTICDDIDFKLANLVEDKQFVCAITDTWSLRGSPRSWGIDDVVGHIQKMDVLADKDFFDKMDAENERQDKIKRKDLRNEMEGFWSYERRRFAKATNDILTHSLSKDEPRKRLKDRSIKNGND